MKRNMMPWLLCVFSPGLFAADNFQCTVNNAYTLERNGELDSTTPVAKIEVGKVFTVDRETGRMIGSGLTNHMSGQQPKVYDYLPQENSYKAITIYAPNFTVDYLEIRTYEDGKLKPFLYKGAWGSIMTGVCANY